MKSTNNENVLFAVVELSRPNTANKSNVTASEPFAKSKTGFKSNVSLSLKAQALPNPTSTNFNLTITSKSNDPVSIIVMKICPAEKYTLPREVYLRNIPLAETLSQALI